MLKTQVMITLEWNKSELLDSQCRGQFEVLAVLGGANGTARRRASIPSRVVNDNFFLFLHSVLSVVTINSGRRTS
jgi:hypothetical protein